MARLAAITRITTPNANEAMRVALLALGGGFALNRLSCDVRKFHRPWPVDDERDLRARELVMQYKGLDT